jgi:hypothetical protein
VWGLPLDGCWVVHLRNVVCFCLLVRLFAYLFLVLFAFDVTTFSFFFFFLCWCLLPKSCVLLFAGAFFVCNKRLHDGRASELASLQQQTIKKERKQSSNQGGANKASEREPSNQQPAGVQAAGDARRRRYDQPVAVSGAQPAVPALHQLLRSADDAAVNRSQLCNCLATSQQLLNTEASGSPRPMPSS